MSKRKKAEKPGLDRYYVENSENPFLSQTENESKSDVVIYRAEGRSLSTDSRFFKKHSSYKYLKKNVINPVCHNYKQFIYVTANSNTT